MAAMDRRPVIAVLAMLAFLLAFLIWVPAAILAARSTIYGYSYNAWWFLGVGLLLLPLSAIGAVSAYRGWRWPLVAYLGLRLLSVIILFILIGSSWAFTTHGAHAWEQRMGSTEMWPKVESCLRRASVCQRGRVYSGCCQKPATCDGSLTSFSNSDCFIFRPDNNALCYSCRICVQTVFRAFQSDWRKMNPILMSSILASALIFIAEISIWGLRQQKQQPPQPPEPSQQQQQPAAT